MCIAVVVQCSEAQWSGVPPTCEVVCPTLLIADNAVNCVKTVIQETFSANTSLAKAQVLIPTIPAAVGAKFWSLVNGTCVCCWRSQRGSQNCHTLVVVLRKCAHPRTFTHGCTHTNVRTHEPIRLDLSRL